VFKHLCNQIAYFMSMLAQIFCSLQTRKPHCVNCNDFRITCQWKKFHWHGYDVLFGKLKHQHLLRKNFKLWHWQMLCLVQKNILKISSGDSTPDRSENRLQMGNRRQQRPQHQPPLIGDVDLDSTYPSQFPHQLVSCLESWCFPSWDLCVPVKIETRYDSCEVLCPCDHMKSIFFTYTNARDLWIADGACTWYQVDDVVLHE